MHNLNVNNFCLAFVIVLMPFECFIYEYDKTYSTIALLSDMPSSFDI